MGTKKRTRRKTYRKRKSKAFPNQVQAISRSPIATTAFVKLRYCDTIAINAPAGGLTGQYLYRVNSLHDPDYSGIGHRCLGTSEWMNFYSRYCVVGSRLTVKCINTSTTVPLQFGILLRQGGVLSGIDPNILKEQGDSTWSYAGNMNNRRQSTVSKNCSIKKFFGYPNPANETDLRASTNANPDVTGYFQIWTAAADGFSDPPNTSFQINMEFLAILSKPIKLEQS